MKAGSKRLSALLLLPLLVLWGCAAAPPRTDSCTVAVWDIERIGPADAAAEDYGPLLTAGLLETLQQSGRCRIVERQKLELALEELRVGASTLADQSARLTIGRLAGANRMVFGAYQVFGNTLRLDVRLVDVATGAVLRSDAQTADSRDVGAWLKAAARAAQTLDSD